MKPRETKVLLSQYATLVTIFNMMSPYLKGILIIIILCSFFSFFSQYFFIFRHLGWYTVAIVEELEQLEGELGVSFEALETYYDG